MEPSDARLPRFVRPRRYRLHFDVDPAADRFSGSVEIVLALDREVSEIQLHAVGLTVKAATLDGRAVGVRPRPEAERVALTLPAPAKAGAATLALYFDGLLQKGLRGLYRAEANGRAYAFTQFEPADARRAFPCFDEPEFKAIFEVSATVPEGLTVLSNGSDRGHEPARKGRVNFKFAPTPPISTYLAALAVGEIAPNWRRLTEDLLVGVHAVPEKLRLTEAALDMACAFLPILADYFGLPYPYGKLDLVAVPDFEAGAMENAGAIFFRESTLLLDPEKATLEATRQVAITVAHEMAHQWFGNLVTMEWWDDLWLNEAFATWMEFKVVDAWKPEWNLWAGFERMKAAPLHLDSLRSTRPIQAEVATPEQANEMFDGITYTKGAAVLRMFEIALGEDRFRDGVRAYLAAHQGGNARAADLWLALEQASGRPVGALAESWFTQGGYPLLTAAARGDRLHLAQRRFFALPGEGSGALWRVPLAVKVGRGGETEVIRGELASAQGELLLPPGRDFLLANAEASGFYRVEYEAETLAALAGRRDALTPVERVSVLADSWALARAGRPLAPHLRLLSAFAADPERTVLETVMAQTAYLEEFVAADADREPLRRWLRSLFAPHLARLGWEPIDGESPDDRLLRPMIVEFLGDPARDPGVREEARERARLHLESGGGPHPSLVGPCLRLAASEGDGALQRTLLARMRLASVPEDRDRLLSALAAFEAPDLYAISLDAALGPDVRAQDVASLLGQLLGNRAARAAAWRFLVDRWPEVAAKTPAFGLRRIVQATARLCDPALRREVEDFFSAREHHVEAGDRDLRQALEAIDIALALRGREQTHLGEWLRAR